MGRLRAFRAPFAASGTLLARLRGIVAARSLRGDVAVAPDAWLGRGVRIAVAPGAVLRVGSGARIGRGVRLEARGGRIDVGAGCRLGEDCTLIAAAGIVLGAGCVLGEGVSVVDYEPVIGDVERPVRAQGIRGVAVHVGPAAVVAPRATIGPGTTVPAGRRVAAGNAAP